MFSLTNNSSKNNTFSFDGGNLTIYGGLVLFKELFELLNLVNLISKHLVTNDQRLYYSYSETAILIQLLYQNLAGHDTDYACQELKKDAYFQQLLETEQVASQPTLSRFFSRATEETVEALRQLNLELIQIFLQFHQVDTLIIDVDSTHFTTYGKQEGSDYNAHYRATGYHPLYAFESQTGYCFNAQLRPGNRYCSDGAVEFLQPILDGFNRLLFRMDSGFASPQIYNSIEESGESYLIKLKRNPVLSRLGDLSLPNHEDENLTILPHSSYSETVYQAKSWDHARRVCQFSQREEGELFYEVTSLVTNLTGGVSEEHFELYRKRGQAENFIKEMKSGFFGDKTDSSTLIKNEVRMMISCLAYNISLFMRHLAGGSVKNLTMKRFRKLFINIAGKCVKSARRQILKLSSLYSLKDEFRALFERISRLNFSLPILYKARDTGPPLLGL